MALRFRRGSESDRTNPSFVPEDGEPVWIVDTKRLYMGDGSTAGGVLITGSSGGGGGTPGIDDNTTGVVLTLSDTISTFTNDVELDNTDLVMSGGNITGTTNINILGNITSSGTVTSNLANIGSVNVTAGIVAGTVIQAPFFNGDLIGSVFADDSTPVFDGLNARVVADVFNNIVQTSELSVLSNNSGITVTSISAGLSGPKLTYKAARNSLESKQALQAGDTILDIVSLGFDGSDDEVPAALIKLGVDKYTTVNSNAIPGRIVFLTYKDDGTTGVENSLVFNRQGRLGINTDEPQEKLDVRGNAVVSGSLTAGDMIIENSLIISNGTLSIGKSTTEIRDTFGDDSSSITGALFYNTTEDRFQFFQAGSWVSLINNGSSMGQVLAWNGSEWAATDPVILEGTIENADALNGQSGAFYLDYNNFTNTPTIPNDLNELGDVDQLLFSGSYTDLTDTPSIPANLTDLTDVTTAGLSANQIYLQSVTRLNVTNSGASAYLFDQYPGNNPTLRAISGTTVAFDLNVTGHPFLIQDNTGTNFDTGLVHVANNGTVTTGSAAQGKETGTLYWKIPNNISGSYQYICSIHGVMVGSIEIADSQFVGDKGLVTRGSLTGSTGSIADGVSANVNITGYKGYMLYKIETSAAAWVRLYVSDAARTADAARTQGQDPLPGSGVIAEVITTSAETVIIAPGVIGFNNESPVTNIVPAAVTNLSGGSANITVTLTAVEMEV
jgi:plastocyanin